MHDTKIRVHTILDTKYEKADPEKDTTNPCHPLLVCEKSKLLNLLRK